MAKKELTYIAEGVRSLAVPIESVRPDPKNVRTHGPRNLKAIMASLANFRQQTPIVIGDDGVILKGNGTYQVAKELGWTHIAAVVTDLDKEAAQRAYAIADNRSGELAEWDEPILAAQLDDLEGEIDVEDVLAFDVAEREAMLAAAKEDEPPEDFPEMDMDLETDHKCPSCGYEWSGKSK